MPGARAKVGARRAAETPVELAPLGFIQVAFAGHRRTEELGERSSAAAALAEAFRLLKAAGVREARLLTGYAVGADRLAAKAWRAERLGEVHAVFPFLSGREANVRPNGYDTATWLDGAATKASGRHPHLAQTRWLLGAADLLVVIWSGFAVRGPGGTADAVRLALEHGLPVLWLDPEPGRRPRLIRAQGVDEDMSFGEVLDSLRSPGSSWMQPATPAALNAALAELGLTASGPAAAEPPRRPRPTDHVAWPWRTYALFRRLLGGRSHMAGADAPPADLAGQRGFALLSAAQETADARARRLGAIHRSHQIILLGLAILAAAAGAASALWPDVKFAMVGLELIVALVALVIWLNAERARRHHEWGQARKLAEDLRLERAAWPIGLSSMPHGPNRTSGLAAGARRRMAGLPEGPFDARRVRDWGGWVVGELVESQVAYHRGTAAINARISHRLHLVENGAFAVLLVVLLTYVIATVGFGMAGAEAPHLLSGLVFAVGAIVPAIGAAGLALEATLALREEAQRSRVLAEQLREVGAALPKEPGLEDLQRIARAAIRLQRAQEDHWSEGTSRRRLFRGG